MSMEKKTVAIVIAVTVSFGALVLVSLFLIMTYIGPKYLKRNRIANRKQFSRQKVIDELHHNVRYSSPDTLSVSLAAVQPRSSRRQTLPAISICSPTQSLSDPEWGQNNYGSIELIRSTVRRYSEVGFNRPTHSERNRKISLDSQVLSRICEESTELYEQEFSRSRRGSTISFSDRDSPAPTEIDLDLYSSTDDIASSSTLTGCGLGRLYFTITYNKFLKNLYVTIIKASYIRTTLIKETSCVYIKVGILPAELNYPVFRTNYVTSMGNPMFNQTFTFHISSIPEQLQLTVKEVRKLESNNVIGYVWFDLIHMLKESSTMSSNQEISREIFGENKLYRRRGDVLVNLRINVSETIELLVHVAEARNFPVKNQNMSVYVRASLLLRHKVHQTKKGQVVKRGFSSPCFNDRFRFIMQNSNDFSTFDECCILLCFCSRSRMRVSHLVGRCIIGPIMYTEGEGLMQWTESINKPGTRVSQWLSLT